MIFRLRSHASDIARVGFFFFIGYVSLNVNRQIGCHCDGAKCLMLVHSPNWPSVAEDYVSSETTDSNESAPFCMHLIFRSSLPPSTLMFNNAVEMQVTHSSDLIWEKFNFHPLWCWILNSMASCKWVAHTSVLFPFIKKSWQSPPQLTA